ncbi:hypothetical protein VNI00_006272 [Paramarasmius palmivorus]|uniref:CxC2-like cysteine cluster KDZ transposase-associated domain-containing protein n=1 Tax=Paramarasmius palmivorus TaxID=297713 RepID=A0AAW0DA32_9AGAR
MGKRRWLKSQGNTYQDRVRFEGDFEDIPYREEGVTSQGYRNVVQSSPGKGRHWSAGSDWQRLSIEGFGDWEGLSAAGKTSDIPVVEDDSQDWQDVVMDDEDKWSSGYGFDDNATREETRSGIPKAKQAAIPQKNPKKRPRKSYRAKRPNIHWMKNFRSIFVTELLRSYGRGDVRKQKSCTDCRGVDPSGVERESRVAQYRCKDCFMGDLVCKQWNNHHFEKTSLRALGHTIQLNHMGMECPRERKCHSKLRILHTNGIHHVDIRFCNCGKRIDQYLQLLRRGLYPSTVNEGRITTCATFSYLDTLHSLSSTTKGSAHDFYRALEKLTDNTGLNLPKSRYRPLLRMIRQWRHLKMVLWSGVGHDPDGIGEQEGRLVVQCPSCPHPGINLPDGWELASRSFLYRLILCLDGNFRLKAQMVSSHSRDPPLNNGMGYFVKRAPYEQWLLSKDEGDEISNCVPLAALAKQNTKFSRGLRYTGVMGVACGRSDMIVRMGNLQKGERYSNSDWIFAKAVEHFLQLLHLLAIYDVACQWFIHLLDRIRAWPPDLSWSDTLDVTAGIGKMHEPGHKQENHEQYSLNNIPGAGNTDGETLERIWGEHNNLGNATKTMGPGSREDYIDAQMGEWNWDKYKAMGQTLHKRHHEAERDLHVQMQEFQGLSANIPATLTQKWRQMCKVWEAAPTPKKDVPNPYHVAEEYMSEEQAMEELATEEQRRVAEGGVRYHAVDAPGFVRMALSLKDSQERLIQKIEEQTRMPTVRQLQKLREQRNALTRQLHAYQELQSIYMPGLLQYLEDTNQGEDSEDTDPEHVPVWLPSGVHQDKIDVICAPKLRLIEARLQLARCYDSLHGLRHALRVKTRMLLFKNTNVRGQRSSGRAWATISRVVSRIQRWATRYRKSRLALLKLIGPGDWQEQLKVLKNEDIRSYRDPATVKVGRGRVGNDEEDEKDGEEQDIVRPLRELEQTRELTLSTDSDIPLDEWDLIPPDRTEWEHRSIHGTGNTRKSVSWIWWRGGGLALDDGADENDNEVLQSEWCRARARAMRAWEEVLLVREEMRRTLAYLNWRAQQWEAHANTKIAASAAHREGFEAFARKQAGVHWGLKESFQKKWSRLMKLIQKTAEDDGVFPEKAEVNGGEFGEAFNGDDVRDADELDVGDEELVDEEEQSGDDDSGGDDDPGSEEQWE